MSSLASSARQNQDSNFYLCPKTPPGTRMGIVGFAGVLPKFPRSGVFHVIPVRIGATRLGYLASFRRQRFDFVSGCRRSRKRLGLRTRTTMGAMLFPPSLT